MSQKGLAKEKDTSLILTKKSYNKIFKMQSILNSIQKENLLIKMEKKIL